MITLEELDEAIRDCESSDRHTYDDCIRLAALYTIKNQLYPDTMPELRQSFRAPADEIESYGESEFLQLVSGKKEESVWSVIDELMNTLEITNPRLYDGVMRKIDRL